MRPAAFAAAALVAAGCAGDSQPERSSRPVTRAPELRCLDSPVQACADMDEVANRGVTAKGWRTDFSRHTVPLDQFESAGIGKDAIRSIDAPRFARASRVAFLRPREPVIELVVRGDARAYAIQILIWHEIVNDRVGGVPVAVTFCPLCNTALAFERRVRGRTLDFGTTGNLRHGDLVMYDRETESWWQQFGGVAVVGRYAGTRLRQVPARIVSWEDFAHRHPDGRVLLRPRSGGGFLRPYGQNPYAGYEDVAKPPLLASAVRLDGRLPPKERVVFLERGGETVVVPFSTLARKRIVRVEAGGEQLVVRWVGGVRSPLGSRAGSADVVAGGRPVPFDQPFWFAVAAFRPDVRIVR